MAGKSSINDNFAPGPPATRYNVSGKNREFYTFENAPGIGAYATGGTIIDGGDGYIYHIFTGNGTFAVNRPSAAIDSVDYLVVAGGGSAGSGSVNNWSGGAGGAGGMLFGNIAVSNTPGSYAISIGAGGATNGPGNTSASRHGFDSSAFGLTAEGGGGGGCPGPLTTHVFGDPGGSGGGAASVPPTGGRPGGTGNTPTTIPRQGYPGTPSSVPSGLSFYGGGGGGAGGEGGYIANGYPAGPPYQYWGFGGPGRVVPQFPIDIIGKAIPSANYPQWYSEVSPSGLAAGGRSYYWAPGLAPEPIGPNIDSAANSGNGGNGNGSNPGKKGGSGIVCVRYKKTAAYERATGGTIEPSTHPEHPGVWRHIFTSPGNFTITDPTLQYIDYLAVGGGGGGGGTGGGGGAGGFVSSIHTSTTTPTSIPQAYPWNSGYSVQVGEQYPVSAGTYPIGIGTGGADGASNSAGTPGNNTTIGSPGPSQIIAAGGGGGGGSDPSPAPFTPVPGQNGASGGGGSKGFSEPGPIAGGTATPSPLIQGNPGGNSQAGTTFTSGAGGGGAGASGSTSTGAPGPYVGGAGGVGWYSVLSPSAYGTPGPLTPTTIYRYFAGGGGGSGGVGPGGSNPGGGGVGGSGGGGSGAPNGSSTAVPGTTNTGGGGGGGGDPGGPGIVIIQYPE